MDSITNETLVNAIKRHIGYNESLLIELNNLKDKNKELEEEINNLNDKNEELKEELENSGNKDYISKKGLAKIKNLEDKNKKLKESNKSLRKRLSTLENEYKKYRIETSLNDLNNLSGISKEYYKSSKKTYNTVSYDIYLAYNFLQASLLEEVKNKNINKLKGKQLERVTYLSKILENLEIVKKDLHEFNQLDKK